MSHTWTPLEIDILLHYYITTTDYHSPSNAATEFIEALVRLNMLKEYQAGVDSYYGITERGKFFLEYILDTPMPIQKKKWVIER